MSHITLSLCSNKISMQCTLTRKPLVVFCFVKKMLHPLTCNNFHVFVLNSVKIFGYIINPCPLQMQFLRVSQLMKLISIWNNKLVESIVALEIFSLGFYHSSLIPVVVVFFKNLWKISCIRSAKKMVQTMTEKALHKSKSLGSIILWFLRHLCQDFNL